MDFNEQFGQFVERVESLKESVETEEATKTSLVMPFFRLLGYDVFNPLEFVPEYTADVGVKKGEKVDYAIMYDGKPLIFIECKSCRDTLDKHASQLFRYFGTTTSAKFAILTNGLIYKFYTDLVDKNKMDLDPFLTVDILNMSDRDLVEISKFTKEALDVENIFNAAENLKYTRMIKEWFTGEMENPSQEFAKVVLNSIYDGVKSQKTYEKFIPLIKRALQQYVLDSMNSKIKIALNKDETETESNETETCEQSGQELKIVTTIEELESYAIIKSILRPTVSSDRIFYRDSETYFAILLDDNNRKWICRAHLNSPKSKYITIADENKKPVRYNIEKLDDIYNYKDEIIQACSRYLN